MKKLIILVLMIMVLVPVGNVFADFDDVSQSHWAYEDINKMVELGYLKGMGNNKFMPNKEVTVAEYTKMLSNIFFKVTDYKQYRPELKNFWYANEMCFGDSADLFDNTNIYNYIDKYQIKDTLIKITNNNELKTYYNKVLFNRPINRYEMGVIAYNMACKNVQKSTIRKLPQSSNSSLDNRIAYNSINSDEQMRNTPFVKYCYENKFITGMDSQGTFNGFTNMTRAQAATIMNRLYKASENNISNNDTNCDNNSCNNTTNQNTTSNYTEKIINQASIVDEIPNSYNHLKEVATLKYIYDNTGKQIRTIITLNVADYRKGLLTNGKANTEENKLELIAQLNELLPTGTLWGGNSGAEYCRGSFDGRACTGNPTDKFSNIPIIAKAGMGNGGCSGYASLVFTMLHGYNAPTKKAPLIDMQYDMKVGDILEERMFSKSVTHYSVVASIPKSCNTFRYEKKSNGEIDYNKKIDIPTIAWDAAEGNLNGKVNSIDDNELVRSKGVHNNYNPEKNCYSELISLDE